METDPGAKNEQGLGTRRWSSFRAYLFGEAGRVAVNKWDVLKMKIRVSAAQERIYSGRGADRPLLENREKWRTPSSFKTDTSYTLPGEGVHAPQVHVAKRDKGLNRHIANQSACFWIYFCVRVWCVLGSCAARGNRWIGSPPVCSLKRARGSEMSQQLFGAVIICLFVGMGIHLIRSPEKFLGTIGRMATQKHIRATRFIGSFFLASALLIVLQWIRVLG